MDVKNSLHAVLANLRETELLKELPGEEAYSCGWMDAAYDVFIPARQHSKAPDYWKKYGKDKSILINLIRSAITK